MWAGCFAHTFVFAFTNLRLFLNVNVWIEHVEMQMVNLAFQIYFANMYYICGYQGQVSIWL